MIYYILCEKYGYNKPIFAHEILDCFKKYTKAYVYRQLNKEISASKIKKFSEGVYYIPSKTILGETSITSRDVVFKKYIYDELLDKVNGIFGGLSLSNEFNLTTQVPNIIFIITNKETTRSREIAINDMKYVLKKSRTEINKENVYTYKLLELLTENSYDDFDEESFNYLKKYIKEKDIKLNDAYSMLDFFPAKTSKNLLKVRYCWE